MFPSVYPLHFSVLFGIGLDAYVLGRRQERISILLLG